MKPISRAALASFVCLLGLSGCSSSDDASGESTPSVTEASTTSTESTTTNAPSTTEATTTTTEATTTTTEDVESAVVAAHEQFLGEVFNFDLGYEEQLRRNEALALDPQKTRFAEFVQGRLDIGASAQGIGYANTTIVDVDIASDEMTADVRFCGSSAADGIGPDGEIDIPATFTTKIRTTQLRNVDGEWKVYEFLTGGELLCDPETGELLPSS